MQAVILSAGKSTRTYPLTANKPKPLLKIANKTILEHNLEQLDGLVDEVIVVVGYKKELIKNAFGDHFGSMPIRYIEQVNQNGTGGAIETVKNELHDRFLVMNGDDIFSKKDISRCITHDSCILIKEVDDLGRFGEVIIEGDTVVDIIEKPEKKAGYANTGLYVFSTEIFNHTLKKSPRGEFEIVDYVRFLKSVSYEVVSEYWLPITYPWNILEANEFFLQKLENTIHGEVEERATIKGNVVIGEGALVKNGAYIEGPVMIGKNCIIGPNCYIRPFTTIGDHSKIGNAVDVKNSVIGEHTSIAHLSYVGDSVVGDDVNLAAGVVTANLRHDDQTIKTPVKGEMVDTGKRKLGAIIGDGSKLGINTSIYPGRKLWPGSLTMPCEIVTKDIEEQK